MKANVISLVFAILVSTFHLHGQTNNTIVNTNSIWSILHMADAPPFNISSYYIKLSDDSTINSIIYKKVLMSADSLHSNWILYGLMREANQKTYYRFLDSTYDMKMYDFSVVVGDSLTIYGPRTDERGHLMYVNKIDSIYINGLKRKRIELVNYHGRFYGDTWIEHIGSLYGILNSCYTSMGLHESLLCYFEKNILVYHHPSYSECYYPTITTKIPDIKSQKTSFYPNPIKDLFHISGEYPIGGILKIYNALGQLILQQTLKGNNETINVQSLPKGVYHYTILEKTTKFSQGSFIKE